VSEEIGEALAHILNKPIQIGGCPMRVGRRCTHGASI